MTMLLSLPVLALVSVVLQLILVAVSTAWSGPGVSVSHNPHGYPRISIGGEHLLPHWIYPTQDKTMNTTFWLEVEHACAAGIRLVEMDLRLGSSSTGNVATLALMQQVASRYPATFFVLRVEFSKMLAEPAAQMLLLDSSSTACGLAACGEVNSLTDSWMALAQAELAALLRLSDAMVPGRVAAVWLCGGSTGEWNYRVSADYKFFSDYNPAIVAEFCAVNLVPNCSAPSVAERDSAGLGNRFLSDKNLAQAYNRHLNNKTTVAIQQLASTTKRVSAGSCLVMAFSGYLYNSANVQPFSGHLGLPELLRCPDLDAVGTPFEYFNASQSPVFGAASPQGPWDTAAAHSKLWVMEDDQRTPFGDQGTGAFGYCPTVDEYVNKARLNLLVSGMHGVGSYLMDQKGLYHADPNDTNATAMVWSAISQARAELIDLQDRPVSPATSVTADASDGSTNGRTRMLTPQVALFTDSTSALFWRLATGEHHSLEDQSKTSCAPGHWPCSDPLSWNQNVLIDPVLALGTLGAPVRQFQLTDLLLDECPQGSEQTGWQQSGCVPIAGLRLAIFANAHVLPDEIQAAIAVKLARNNVTCFFSYAAGVLDTEGATVPNGIGIATGLGSSIVRGKGSLLLNVSLQRGVGEVSGWWGIGAHPQHPDPVDPWFYLADDVSHHDRKPSGVPACSSMGRYTANGKIAIGRCQLADHAVVFSGLPVLPTPLWREIARQAGVHAFVDGDAVVEVADTSMFLKCTGEHWKPHVEAHVVDGAAGAVSSAGCTIRLPDVVAAVATSAGVVVCEDCDHWAVPTGSSELYHLSFKK